MLLKNLCFITLALVISSCSSLPDWMGGEPEKKPLEGKREDVFGHKLSQITVENKEDVVKITSPNAIVNNGWHYSHNGEYIGLPQNLVFNSSFAKFDKINIGKGSGDYGVRATPVTENNMIFAIDAHGKVSAYDMNNIQKPVWTYNVYGDGESKKKLIGANIAIENNILYIDSGLNKVIALKADDGKEIWIVKLHNSVAAAPAIGASHIYVMTVDNRVFAIEKQSGKMAWIHETIEGEILTSFDTSPLIFKDKVIVPYSSGELYTLNAKTGEDLWNANLAYNKNGNLGFMRSDIVTTPVIADNAVYVATSTGMIHAIDIERGVSLWEKIIPEVRDIWVAGNYLYSITNNHQLVCMDKSSSKVLWMKNIADHVDVKKESLLYVMMVNSNIWVIVNSGKIVEVNNQGEYINTHKLPDGLNSMPIFFQGKIASISSNGTVYISK
jgi:outer membrane protein assembly factor BamB